MTKYLCTVTQVNEYEIELDEKILNGDWLKEFRDNFYNFHDLEEHAEHLAQFVARFEDESFIEGYGHVTRDGKMLFDLSDYDEEGNKVVIRKPAMGININVLGKSEVEVEVNEIKVK